MNASNSISPRRHLRLPSPPLSPPLPVAFAISYMRFRSSSDGMCRFSIPAGRVFSWSEKGRVKKTIFVAASGCGNSLQSEEKTEVKHTLFSKFAFAVSFFFWIYWGKFDAEYVQANCTCVSQADMMLLARKKASSVDSPQANIPLFRNTKI